MGLFEHQGQFVKKADEEGGLIAKFRNLLNRRTSLDRRLFGDDAPEFGSQEPEYRTYTNIGATVGRDFSAYDPYNNEAWDTLRRGTAGTTSQEALMRLLSSPVADDYAMYVNKNPFGGYSANIMLNAADDKGNVVRDSWGRDLRNTINVNGLDEQSARALAAAMEDKDLGLRKALQDSWNAKDPSEDAKNAVREVMWKGRPESYDFVIHDAIESAKKKMKSGQEVADDVDFHSRAAQGISPYEAHANKFNSKATIPYIKAFRGKDSEALRDMLGDKAYAELQKGHGLALGPTQDKLTAFLTGESGYDNIEGMSKSVLRQLKGRKLSNTAKLTGAAGLASAVGANIAPFVGEESDDADVLRNGLMTTALMTPSMIEAHVKGKAAINDWKVNQDRILRWRDATKLNTLDHISKQELEYLLKGVKPRGGASAVAKGLGVAGLSFLPFLTKDLRGDSKEVTAPADAGSASGSTPAAEDSSAAESPLPITAPSVAGEPDVPSSLQDVVQDTEITSHGKPIAKPVTPASPAPVSKPSTGSIDWSSYATPMSVGGLIGAGLGGILGGDRDTDEEAYDRHGRRVKKKGPFSRTTGALLGGAAGAGLGALYKNIYG